MFRAYSQDDIPVLVQLNVFHGVQSKVANGQLVKSVVFVPVHELVLTMGCVVNRRANDACFIPACLIMVPNRPVFLAPWQFAVMVVTRNDVMVESLHGTAVRHIMTLCCSRVIMRTQRSMIQQ